VSESLVASGVLSPDAQYVPTVSAICGLPLSGQAITGVLVAPPGSITLTVGQAGYTFGPYAVEATDRQDITLVVGEPGEQFGARPVTLALGAAAQPVEAGYVLGAYSNFVHIGQVFLWPNDCTEVDLAPADCSTLVLAAADCSTVPLAPLIPR